MTGYRLDDLGSIFGTAENFLFVLVSGPALETTHPSVQLVKGKVVPVIN
jgi:hypothetical protein